jgi:hypothetical protein
VQRRPTQAETYAAPWTLLKAACAEANSACGNVTWANRKKLLQFRETIGRSDERNESPLRRMLFDHGRIV